MEPTTSPARPLREFDGPLKLIGFSWRLFSKHWKILVPIAFAPYALIFIGESILGTGRLSGPSAPFMIIGFVVTLAGVVLSIVMTPALLGAIDRFAHDAGSGISIKGQYMFGFGYFWSLILIALIGVFVAAGSTALFIIPGIVVMVYTIFYTFALVIDGKKGFAAFTESYSLVKGRWWGVFGRMLSIILALFVCEFIFEGAAAIIRLGAGDGTLGLIVSALFSLAFVAISAPVAMIYFYRMYVCLRWTRSPDVPTKAFERWIVAFLCIGILASPFIAVSAAVLRRAGRDMKPSDRSYGDRMLPASPAQSDSSTTHPLAPQ